MVRGDPGCDDVEAPVVEGQVLGAADDVGLHPRSRVAADDLDPGLAEPSRDVPAAGRDVERRARAARPTRRARSRSGPSRWASLVRYCSARSLQTSVMPPAPPRARRPRASSARRAGSGGAASARIGAALLGVRAVEADDERQLEPHLLERLQDPARDLVAARDAAEDVEEDRLHLRVARDHGERVDDALRVAAAAEVAEVGRAAAGEGDDVDRRHRQPGAVTAHAHLAVELDVGDVLRAGERLERVGGVLVAHLGDLGMAVERVVVDGELRIERLDDALGRHDQRVDLAEHGVEAHECVVELADDLGDLLLLGRIRDAGAVDEASRLPGVEALERVDVEPHERLGILLRDLLDLDAALRREHEQRLPGAAVERQREVVLLRDVGRLLDPEALDDMALDVEPDDVLRVLLGLVRVAGELDPACLAAPAGEDLGLDDDRAAEHLRRLPRLPRRRCQPTLADRDPDAPKELLALVLVEVHWGFEPTCAVVRASTPCVAPSSCARAPRPPRARGCRLRAASAWRPRRYKAPPQTARARLGRALPGREAGARLRRLVVHCDARRLAAPTSRWRTAPTSAGRWASHDEAALRFGVLLFPTDDLDELERRTRPATCLRSAPRRATRRRSRRARAAGDVEGHDLGARCAGRRSVGADSRSAPS